MRNAVVPSPLTRRGRARWVVPWLAGLSLAAAVVLRPDSASVVRPAHEIGDASFALIDSLPLPRPPAAPIDVALLPGGRLFVADGLRHAVLAYDALGQERGLWEHPPLPRTTTHAFVPIALAADGDRDRVFVLWQRHSVRPKLSADGLFLEARAGDGTAVGNLRWVGGVPVDVEDMAIHRPSGDLWLLAEGSIFRLRPAQGTLGESRALAPADAGARALAVADDGRILVPRPDRGEVAVYDPEEGLRTVPVQAGAPMAAAYDPAGGWRLLVRDEDADNPRAALLAHLDEADTESVRSAAALQAPPLPDLAWPWALDVAADGVAFSTASRRLRVQVEPSSGPSPAGAGGRARSHGLEPARGRGAHRRDHDARRPPGWRLGRARRGGAPRTGGRSGG